MYYSEYLKTGHVWILNGHFQAEPESENRTTIQKSNIFSIFGMVAKLDHFLQKKIFFIALLKQ
jgi:hypothetical protein